MSSKKIYLDHAASTPMRPEVIQKMQQAMQTYANPSATHSFGRSAKALIEKARRNIANEFNVSPAEIIFTSGGTESINSILKCAVRDLNITQIITSPAEHHAVLNTVKSLEEEYGTLIAFVKITPEGQIDLQHLEKLLSETPQGEKTLVSLMHVNNETGSILPIEKVGELCHQYGALFHSDTVQSVGHFPLDLSQIKVDFISCSAHKFHGPKGVGFSYISQRNKIGSLLLGGEQERGQRAGTEAIHNIVGLEEAFLLAYQNLSKEREYVLNLKKNFISLLKKNIPEVRFNAQSDDPLHSAYTIINIGLPTDAKKTEIAMVYLDMKNIACSRGSACQSGAYQPSHVLRSFLPENELKTPNLRFSFSHFNTPEEIEKTVETLKEFVNTL